MQTIEAISPEDRRKKLRAFRGKSREKLAAVLKEPLNEVDPVGPSLLRIDGNSFGNIKSCWERVEKFSVWDLFFNDNLQVAVQSCDLFFMTDPLIAIVGDTSPERTFSPPMKDPVKAKRAAEELGKELAKRGAKLLVYGPVP